MSTFAHVILTEAKNLSRRWDPREYGHLFRSLTHCQRLINKHSSFEDLWSTTIFVAKKS